MLLKLCEICRKNPCDTHCPNHIPPKSTYYCSICKDPIENGEEYIENDMGEYAHYECFRGTKDLLKWLRYDIRTKEDNNV